MPDLDPSYHEGEVVFQFILTQPFLQHKAKCILRTAEFPELHQRSTRHAYFFMA
jgi:hypothetical protein